MTNKHTRFDVSIADSKGKYQAATNPCHVLADQARFITCSGLIFILCVR